MVNRMVRVGRLAVFLAIGQIPLLVGLKENQPTAGLEDARPLLHDRNGLVNIKVFQHVAGIDKIKHPVGEPVKVPAITA